MGFAPRSKPQSGSSAGLCWQRASLHAAISPQKATSQAAVRLAAQGPAVTPPAEAPGGAPDYAQQLPLSLRRAIPGPALHVGSGSWTKPSFSRSTRSPLASSRAARARPQRAGKLRLRRVSKGVLKLQYRLGQAIAPEQIRIASRSELRIVMKLGPAARRALKGVQLDRPGVSVRASAIGQERVSLRVKSDERWEIGALKNDSRGWSLMIRADPKTDLALR